MAQTKSTGSSVLGRDSRPKYLGIKAADGAVVKAGAILVRQRGTNFVAGKNTDIGGDNTIFAKMAGTVQFTTKRKARFDGSRTTVRVVTVTSLRPPAGEAGKPS